MKKKKSRQIQIEINARWEVWSGENWKTKYEFPLISLQRAITGGMIWYRTKNEVHAVYSNQREI